MGLQPIPPAWREAVCAAIRRGQHYARFTAEGHKLWQRGFPDCWRHDLDAALLHALTANTITGCPVTMDSPPGETWEFYFTLQGQRAYGKLLLRIDHQSVVIFSAHHPRKTKLRCE